MSALHCVRLSFGVLTSRSQVLPCAHPGPLPGLDLWEFLTSAATLG